MAEPPITIRAVHDSGGGNLPINRVVIHSTCPNVGYPAASGPGAQHGTALYFTNPASGGSAHYVTGVDGEEHCVPEAVIAWHAPPNENSIGIEICSEGGDYPNNYSLDQWLSPQVWPAVQRAAVRTADLCQRYGVPTVKLTAADLLAGKHGICGHVDVSQAWRETDHTDPGPNFPWPEFLAAVTGVTPTGTASLPIVMEDDMQLPVGQTVLLPVPNVPGFKAQLLVVADSVSGSVVYSKGVKPGGGVVPVISAATGWLKWLAPGWREVVDLGGLGVTSVELVNQGAQDPHDKTKSVPALASAVVTLIPA